MAPAVSVVMPVRDALPYLDQSIASVLGQTVADLELIVLDDASRDGSGARLRAWAERDDRVRVFRSDTPLGVSGSSNAVVARASAPIVARMDADDVSLPHRLERQLAVFERRPDVVLAGTLREGMDARGKIVHPGDRGALLRRSTVPPFPHGSYAFRREAFEAVGGYLEECAGWEDVDLAVRLLDRGRAAVVPEVLYRYRYHSRSATAAAALDEAVAAAVQMERFLARRTAAEVDASVGEQERGLVRAIHAQGALRLWAGQRPGVLVPLLRRLGWPRVAGAAGVLAWAAWGAASPASLRAFLRWRMRVRDRLAERALRGAGVWEWSCG